MKKITAFRHWKLGKADLDIFLTRIFEREFLHGEPPSRHHNLWLDSSKLSFSLSLKKSLLSRNWKQLLKRFPQIWKRFGNAKKEVISFFGKTSLWSSHTLFIKVVKIVVSDIVGSGIQEEGHIKAIIGQRWRLIKRKCLEYIEDMRKHYGRM